MGGKVFLNRNLKKSSSSVYYRYFLWAAVGLVILVVITPLMTHRRSDKATSKKVTPENGMVVREIPKSSPMDSTASPTSQESTPIETIKEANLEPGSAVSNNPPQAEEEVQPSNDAERPSGVGEASQGTDSAAQSQVASITGQQQPAITPETPSATESNQIAVPPSAAPAATPQESAPSESALPQQATASSPPQQQPAPPPVESSSPPVKPAATHGTRYIVQIGSFTQRQNADNIQQSLLQKGYEVVVRTINHAKFGKLYVVQLASVNDARKAESLMASVRKEANVKPMLVKVPAGQ